MACTQHRSSFTQYCYRGSVPYDMEFGLHLVTSNWLLPGRERAVYVFTQQASIPSNALIASFSVAYRVTKCKIPHNIVEELFLPAALDMDNIMMGESAGKLITKILLSNNIIIRRILHIAENLCDQLIEKMKGTQFALQLGYCHILFVIYAFWIVILLLKTFFSTESLKTQRFKS